MPLSQRSTIPRRLRGFDTAEEPRLPMVYPDSTTICLPVPPGSRALEDDGFPFEVLSDVAESESWRKEINRPITHIHKWWAQRLGTVFRAMTIGAFSPSGTDIFDLFYKPVRIPGSTVFDPFMGSGTTLVETVKLGARAIGRDINPVAHFLVKCALSIHNRGAILETFHSIERDVADEIRTYLSSHPARWDTSGHSLLFLGKDSRLPVLLHTS
jgi:hypothetical protein